MNRRLPFAHCKLLHFGFIIDASTPDRSIRVSACRSSLVDHRDTAAQINRRIKAKYSSR